MDYDVCLHPKARRELEALSSAVQRRLGDAIAELAANPRPHGYIKLTDIELYRIRVGEYRIVYAIHDDILTVLVVRIAARKDAYR